MNKNNFENYMPGVDDVTDSVGDIAKKIEEIPKEKIDQLESAAEKTITQGAKAAMGAMEKFEGSAKKMSGMLDDFLAEEGGVDVVESVDKGVVEKQVSEIESTEPIYGESNNYSAGGMDSAWKNEAYEQGLTDEQIAMIEANTTEEERMKYENASEEEKKKMLESKAQEMGYGQQPAEQSEANYQQQEKQVAAKEKMEKEQSASQKIEKEQAAQEKMQEEQAREKYQAEKEKQQEEKVGSQ